MSGGDALLAIAEIAIAIAGFSGVVSAFTLHGTLARPDRSRFIWLFVTASVAALLAFVPIVLSQTGLTNDVLWRASSGIMVAAWLISMGLWLAAVLRRRRDPTRGPASFADGPLLVVPAASNLALQLINVWGGAWQPSPAAYTIGTLVWLYAAALAFLSMVLERPDS